MTTAREITLTGAVTGTALFDGSSNITINTSGSGAASTSANQLTTARSITLSGAVTGTALFDGSSNITISTTFLGAGNFVAKSGDSMSGSLNVNGLQLVHSSSSIIVPGSGSFGSLTSSSTISAVGDIIAYASDARLKKNVVVIENAMDKIGTLGGYSYDWDMEKTRRLGFTPCNEHEHGLLAQEVQKVLPDAVCAAPFNADYLTVKYERLIALLVAGMNEQQAQINALISEVEDLKNQR